MKAAKCAMSRGCRHRWWRLRAVLIVMGVLSVLTPPSPAQTEPDRGEWQRWDDPEEARFRSERLQEAEQQWAALADAPLAAMVVVFQGRILISLGDETADHECHSVRKSLLSALYGIHIERGTINVDLTLEELGIDDSTPLTEAERQATVLDLLMARSGVYLPAACETQGMRDARPERGTHPPGTFWFYNNWDFNALGTIFRQETGRDIFREFEKRIARPLGMQEFRVSRCSYYFEREYSEHPCYVFRMSARDRARFGQLFLQAGRWGRRQVVPTVWVAESTRAISDARWMTGDPGTYYGMMWWNLSKRFFRTLSGGSHFRHLSGFTASGYGGQLILVLPDADIVVATACDVPAGCFLDANEWGPVLETILTAREVVDLRAGLPRVANRIVGRGESLRVVTGIKNLSRESSLETAAELYLSLDGQPEGALERLGRIAVDPMMPGSRRSIRFSGAVPADLQPGFYRVVIAIDPEKVNFDLRRSNNLRVSRQVVEIR